MYCHKFPNIICQTKTAHSLYDLLMYHLQTKSYVKCPKDMTSHTAKFFQQHKTRKSLYLPVTLLSKMTARRLRIDTTEPSQLPTLVRLSEFNACDFYVEAINPLFDPK